MSKNIIKSMVEDYAIFHGVETDNVEVTYKETDNGRTMVRLSLDIDGHSHGCDEEYEVEE